MNPKKHVTLHGKTICIGDRIWSFIYGWCTVSDIFTKEIDYPIELLVCREENSKGCITIASNGREHLDDVSPTFFWKEQQFDFSKPLPQLKVDTLLEVWDFGGPKYLRYFSHFDSEGNVHCFNKGTTSLTSEYTTNWDNYEIYNEEKC